MEKSDLVNIPRHVSDIHYRYKMPSIVAKIEGRGNGIKTRFINLSEVAKSLHPHGEVYRNYIIKFFGFELGAMVNTRDLVINGKYDSSDLQDLLDKYVDKYVLCAKCQNPETLLFIKKETVKRRCKACGHVTICDVSHKLSNYIYKFPPIDPNTDHIKKDTLDSMLSDEFAEKISDNDDTDTWALSTEPEAVAKRQNLQFGNSLITASDDNGETEQRCTAIIKKITPVVNPIPFLSEYWQTTPTDNDVVSDMCLLTTHCHWSDEDCLKNMFASMWMKFIPEGAILKAHYLSLMIKGDEKKQKQILHYMELMATENKQFALRYQDILAMFWEENVLDEISINKWFKHPQSKIPETVSKFIRSKSENFMKWLNQPECDEGKL